MKKKVKKKVKKKKEALDYLLIPTGWEKQRNERTMKELEERDVKNIFFLNGFDSEEDMIYLGKILKGKERIGIVTFPLHYNRYVRLIKRAEKQGIFPKSVKAENVRTKQTLKQFIYGILSLIEELSDRKRKLDFRKNRHEKEFMLKMECGIKSFLKK